LEDVKALIEELEIACPESGSRNWTEVRQFNLMFGTKLELLLIQQWIYICVQKRLKVFCEFLECTKIRNESSFWDSTNRKAFRNEIVARQFIFRMREFEQMEMQFFVRQAKK
jgi:glycyl-tRNA synthetase